MEFMEVFSAFINTSGFPIAAFLLLFWYINTTMKEMQSIMTQNNQLLTKLLERLEKE